MKDIQPFPWKSTWGVWKFHCVAWSSVNQSVFFSRVWVFLAKNQERFEFQISTLALSSSIKCHSRTHRSFPPKPTSRAKMHPFSFILSALFALTVVHAVPGGQPSNVPTCTYTCPPKDQANFSLGTHNDSNGILFCSYPISSRSEHSYHCIYSKVSRL
jgi:hypothetical protein